jgi:hemerythrin-like domain-containing protein
VDPNKKMADSRDMYPAHAVFRREFTAVPALARSARDGDSKRARQLATHVEFLIGFLHGHHEAEDRIVWPKILERGSVEVAPLVETMESQHDGLDKALKDLHVKADLWKFSASSFDAEAVATAVETLLPHLYEHLDTEEATLLTLIDKYIYEDEWAKVGGSSMSSLPKSMLAVSFGMALYEADEEMIGVIKYSLPAVPWAIFSRVGPGSFRRYARKIHGTPTPTRSDVLV